MSYYAYKRVRELIPEHLEDRYRKVHYEELPNKDFYWGNEPNGNLFEAAADYIQDLRHSLQQTTRFLPKVGHEHLKAKIDKVLNLSVEIDIPKDES